MIFIGVTFTTDFTKIVLHGPATKLSAITTNHHNNIKDSISYPLFVHAIRENINVLGVTRTLIIFFVLLFCENKQG